MDASRIAFCRSCEVENSAFGGAAVSAVCTCVFAGQHTAATITTPIAIVVAIRAPAARQTGRRSTSFRSLLFCAAAVSQLTRRLLASRVGSGRSDLYLGLMRPPSLCCRREY